MTLRFLEYVLWHVWDPQKSCDLSMSGFCSMSLSALRFALEQHQDSLSANCCIGSSDFRFQNPFRCFVPLLIYLDFFPSIFDGYLGQALLLYYIFFHSFFYFLALAREPVCPRRTYERFISFVPPLFVCLRCRDIVAPKF